MEVVGGVPNYDSDVFFSDTDLAPGSPESYWDNGKGKVVKASVDTSTSGKPGSHEIDFQFQPYTFPGFTATDHEGNHLRPGANFVCQVQAQAISNKPDPLGMQLQTASTHWGIDKVIGHTYNVTRFGAYFLHEYALYLYLRVDNISQFLRQQQRLAFFISSVADIMLRVTLAWTGTTSENTSFGLVPTTLRYPDSKSGFTVVHQGVSSVT